MFSPRKVFELPEYTTVSGRNIKKVRVGYETWGQLNAARDNAILVCHYFSGTAHATGRYREDDPLPGWWDVLIGPGKAIDTNRYFVICSDTLCCIRVFDGHVVTTGPATINPETGEPWGPDFPVIGIDDLVHVQSALLDHLGIRQLHAVAGPSAGSMQAVQWAVEYPERVQRVLAIISPGLSLHPYVWSMSHCMCAAIRNDPAWKDGRYALKQQPLLGMTQAFHLLNLNGLSFEHLENAYGHDWADPQNDPRQALSNDFRSNAGLAALAAASAQISDANHFLYMERACALFDVRSRIQQAKARFLFVPVENDLTFPPFMSERAVSEIRAAGGEAGMTVLRAAGGHYAGLATIHEAGDAIERFLE